MDARLTALDEKVETVHGDSRAAHSVTQTKIDGQALILARLEERAEAAARAAQQAADASAKAWSPQAIAAVIGGVIAILSGLGYGVPKALDAAAHPSPPVVVAPVDVLP